MSHIVMERLTPWDRYQGDRGVDVVLNPDTAEYADQLAHLFNFW